jgi:penicillin-binding protein 1C
MERLDRHEAASLVVRDAQGALLRQEASEAGNKDRWIPLEEISPNLIAATLASEDNDFYEHGGVDWAAIARASWLNLAGGHIAFGGSTITMQLVRLTLGTRRNLRGKFRQALYAARLERQMSKEEILEQYLNRVYYGNGAWGAEQAARFYFGKSAASLSVGEAASLAVLPRGPSNYDPFHHPDRLRRRREHILGLMAEHGYISAADRDLALAAAIDLGHGRNHFRAPHFVELVKERLPERFRRAARVETTLDWALQRRVEEAVRNHVRHLTPRNLTQAAVVVMRNRDGAVLAFVGSADYADATHNGAFNGATAHQRPGSTLKPFVYGSAIERGDTPATLAYDVPLREDANEFYTKDVKSHGPARYRESLAGSYNLSAVHTLQRVGIPTVLDKLRRAGLSTLDRPDEDYDWGLAIGHAEVRLIDLVGAFSVFGRGGRAMTPRVVERATALDGESWQEPRAVRERVFSEGVAYLLFDILSDPDARKPMFGDRVPMNLPFKVALKTGTTKAYTDLWAFGATREYTVGVWGGNFDGQPTHQVMSVEGATPLMRAVYTAIAARYGAPTAPRRPAQVVEADVCPLSGKRPGAYCLHRKRELFLAGHLPEESCDWHRLVCGQPGVVYPPEVRGWAEFHHRVERAPCELARAEGSLSIVAPVNGAHFVLEDHRPAEFQRPPLAARPSSDRLHWTVDGTPVEQWAPTRGRHRLRVSDGHDVDEIEIVYE